MEVRLFDALPRSWLDCYTWQEFDSRDSALPPRHLQAAFAGVRGLIWLLPYSLVDRNDFERKLRKLPTTDVVGAIGNLQEAGLNHKAAVPLNLFASGGPESARTASLCRHDVHGLLHGAPAAFLSRKRARHLWRELFVSHGRTIVQFGFFRGR